MAAEEYKIAIVIEGKDRASGPIGRVSSALGELGRVAGGVLLANAITAVARGLVNMGRQALDVTSWFERMEFSLRQLSARELLALNTGKRFAEVMREQAGWSDQQVSRYLSLRQEYERLNDVLRRMAESGQDNTQYYEYLAGVQDRIKAQIIDMVPDFGNLSDAMRNAALGGLSMADALRASVKPAKELEDWIIKLAIRSPFSVEGVTNAYKTAFAYGFASDEARKLTEQLVDFSAATGASSDVLDRIALALGQVRARGRLMGQEVLQLTNAFVPVVDILRDMGYELEDVKNGSISAEEFLRGFSEYMEKNFAGAAERQMETWAGLRNTLSDIAKLGLKNFFGGVFEVTKPLAKELSVFMQEEGLDRLKKWGETLGLVLNGILAFARGDLGTISGVLYKLGVPQEVISGVIDFRIQIGRLWDKAKEAFGNLYQLVADKLVGFFSNDENRAKIAQFFEGIKGVAQTVVDWFKEHEEDFANLFRGIYEGIAGVVEWILDVARDIGDAFGPTVMNIVRNLGILLSNVFEWLKSLWEKHGEGITADVKWFVDVLVGIVTGAVGVILTIVDTLLTFINAIILSFKGDMKGFDELLRNWGDGLINLWQQWTDTLGAELLQFIGDIIDTISGFLKAWLGLVAEYFSGWWETVKAAWQATSGAILGFIVSTVQDVWNNMKRVPEYMRVVTDFVLQKLEEWKEAIKDFANRAVDTWRGWVSDMGAKASELLSNIADSVTTFLNSVREAISEAAGDVISGLSDIVGNIMAFVSEHVGEVKRTFKSIGTAIVDGIKKGVRDGWSLFVSWITSAVMEIVEKVKGVLGINSPSLVFAGIGESLMEGLALGAERRSWQPVAAVGAAVQRVVHNTWNFYSYGQGMGEDEFLRAVSTAQFLAGYP